MRKPRRGQDRDHLPGGKLTGEPVLFHEDGHLFANTLKIGQYSRFVSELIADVFERAYIRVQRPDLKWLIDNVPEVTAPPRYTSLFDLEYAGGGDPPNYIWYQGQLERLADFLTKDQDFPALMEKFEKAFPPGRAPDIDGIIARLETVHPGFSKELGPLKGPSTLLKISPGTCQAPTSETRRSAIVIQNDTNSSLDVTIPDRHKLPVAEHGLRSIFLPVGSSLKLSDDRCLTVRDEPSLAVFK